MIHNSFRRIALAQGLLPTPSDRTVFSDAAGSGDADLPDPRVRDLAAAGDGFGRSTVAVPGHLAGQQIQV
jgi:hypothetical protein